MTLKYWLLGLFISTTATAASVHEYPVNQRYQDSIIGGLSGLSYEAATDSFWVLSDDRGGAGGPRIYKFRFDEHDQPEFLDVIYLKNKAGENFDFGLIDSEGLIVDPEGFWVSVEPTMGAPSITHRRFNRAGVLQFNRAIDIGPIKPNKGVESFASHDGLYLFGVEDSKEGQREGEVSIYCDDLSSPPTELVYQLEEFDRANGDTGLVSLTYHPQLNSWLSLERQYVHKMGNQIKVFRIDIDCDREGAGVAKTLLVDLVADLELSPDNVEAMSVDSNGNLVLVSDNNFNHRQRTQIIKLSLKELLSLQ